MISTVRHHTQRVPTLVGYTSVSLAVSVSEVHVCLFISLLFVYYSGCHSFIFGGHSREYGMLLLLLLLLLPLLLLLLQVPTYHLALRSVSLGSRYVISEIPSIVCMCTTLKLSVFAEVYEKDNA
eukprot:GHVU01068184.1.p3 GENE.GHVU01068184.1~~GHVU01068184.1.p3  ORF type:complete len:124 (+),score=17.67 GHVU01068184.1:1282-1653(+)